MFQNILQNFDLNPITCWVMTITCIVILFWAIILYFNDDTENAIGLTVLSVITSIILCVVPVGHINLVYAAIVNTFGIIVSGCFIEATGTLSFSRG